MPKKCQNCGTEMADNMNFCPKCHQKVESAPSPAPSEQQPVSAAGTPTKSKGKKIGTVIGTVIGLLILIGGIAGSLIQPWLLKKGRCERLQEILVRDAGFKAGSVEARHLNGLQYGVWVVHPLGGGMYLHDKNKPAFRMVLNEETNLWQFPTEEDKKQMTIYSKVSNGDIDALLE